MEIGEERARHIAVQFFAQYHSVIDAKATRNDGRWIVKVALQGGHDKEVTIDAISGTILAWNIIDSNTR